MLLSLKAFIRYISHEIRTPLNIVMSGLKVLEEDIYGNGSVEKTMETILDTRSACVIAVDTLSEMLTFDKITQGLMSLEMTTFEVYSFVTECLRPFRLQVFPLI
jgi:signal transduction histidine kinase